MEERKWLEELNRLKRLNQLNGLSVAQVIYPLAEADWQGALKRGKRTSTGARFGGKT